MEYKGELLSSKVAHERESSSSYSDGGMGYMMFFRYREKGWCVDASKESGDLSRLINHSKKRPNITAKIGENNGIPYIYFEAIRDIAAGEELLYDYGERRKEMLIVHPWLRE